MSNGYKILAITSVVVGVILGFLTGGKIGLIHEEIPWTHTLKSAWESAFWVTIAWCIGIVRFTWPPKS
jgi:hypothetical protein